MQTHGFTNFFSRPLPLFLLVVAAACIFRLPYLLNPAEVNSDFAFLALQGKRMWDGEWFWHLWGSSYQGIVEPLFIGGLFKLFGDSPLVLMLEPLLGLFALLALSLSLLRRYLSPTASFFLCLFLILVPEDVLMINMFPFRQWSITAMFFSIWIIENTTKQNASWRLPLAGFVTAFAHYLDFYAIQFLVATFIFATLKLVDKPRVLSSYKKILPYLAGFALGGFLLLLVRTSLSQRAPLTFSFKTLFSTEHYEVFVSALVHVLGLNWNLDAGSSSRLFWGVVLGLSATIVFAGFLYGIYLSLKDASLPEGLKRLGLFGAASIFTSILATAGSPVAVDMWSSRYMTPIYWGAPFALAPVAWKIGTYRYALLFSWFSLAVGTIIWICYPPVSRNFEDRVEALEVFLTSNKLNHAVADYWIAYQLTYLFDEDPIVVSRNRAQERYQGYREAVDRAPIHTEIWMDEKAEGMEKYLLILDAKGLDFQTKRVGGFTVVWGPKLPNSYELTGR